MVQTFMGQEEVLELILTSDIECLFKDPKSLQLLVNDFSYGTPVPKNFGFRFLTKELAENYKEVIDKVRHQIKRNGTYLTIQKFIAFR